jgi:hypothetical protein
MISDYDKVHYEGTIATNTSPDHLPLTLTEKMLEITKVMDGSLSAKELKQRFGRGIVEQTVSILGRWGLLENQSPVWN